VSAAAAQQQTTAPPQQEKKSRRQQSEPAPTRERPAPTTKKPAPTQQRRTARHRPGSSEKPTWQLSLHHIGISVLVVEVSREIGRL